MDVDVRGRVANVKLGKSRCLLPLFEAIMNAIHAIEETDIQEGKVEIQIERDRSAQPLPEVAVTSDFFPIAGFFIVDNGIGFDDHHFRSFCKSDTTEKVAKGGKGVGRFVWLKAFKAAKIASTFRHENGFKKREFTFSLSETGIVPNDPKAKECDEKQPQTIVHLSGFIQDYQEKCPKTADAIANRIVEHFLELFILKKCPKSIMLVDRGPEGETRIDLTRRFNTEMKMEAKSQKFQIKGTTFGITHVRLASSHVQQHSLNFCAHGRTVRTEQLSKVLPYLQTAIPDEAVGRTFTYAGYISSGYLNDSVLAERTAFGIYEVEPELDFEDEISWPELLSATTSKAKGFLQSYLEPLHQAKQERVREFVSTKAPQYKHLLTKCKDDVELIPSNSIADDKLDLELYKIDQKHDAALRSQYTELLANGDKTAVSHANQRKRFEKFLEDWNEAGMAKLARHVAHRKATLAFLEDRLGKDGEEGKYATENAIHEIIFPLKKTSDDVPPDQMNLWILDEKLAYHFYLASDKPLSQMKKAVKIDSSDRPDLAIFGHPFAFVDASPIFGSVTIIEFKRPVRDDYDDDDNPISQVYRYIKQIRAGASKDRKGRPIIVQKNTPFYAYIVCDLTPKLEEQGDFAKLTKTPDGLGMFGYNDADNIGVYIEIISFPKLVEDAKKRNAAFFDKLGLGK